MRIKVKDKSYLPINILLLAMFVGILVYIYNMQIQVFRQSSVEQIATNTSKHEREINSWFTQKMSIVDIISEDLRHFNLIEVRELEDFLTKITITNPGVMSAYIGLDDKSAVFNDRQQAPEEFDPTIRVWYVLARKNGGKTAVSEPYIDIFTGKLVVALSKSIRLNNGMGGVIGIDIDLEHITDFVNSIQPYYTGTSFLLSGNGSIITHADTSLLPKKTGMASGKTTFTQYGEFNPDHVDHIRTSNSNISMRRITSGKEKKYVAQIKISDVGWIYGSEIPLSAFEEDIVRITAPLASIILIGMLIFISNMIFNWYHINALKRSKRISETLNKTASIYLSHSESTFEDIMAEGIIPNSDLIGLDRVSIFRNAISEDGFMASQIYCWSRVAGVTQLNPALTSFRYNDVAREWKRLFTSGESINSPVRKLLGSEAALLKSSGTLSVFANPVFINETFWGFVLYEDHNNERYFNEDFAKALSSASLLFVNTILRAEMERKIKRIAHTDSLTGILNRLRFMELTAKQIERIKRTGSNSYIVLFDLDYFKNINDTHGHLIGDRVLKCVAERVNSTIRPYDIFGRYGGEEFILFISDINEADAKNNTERIRLAICNSPMVFEDVQITVSSSFGVASVVVAESLKDVINIADKALYQAKKDGRNRVVMA